MPAASSGSSNQPQETRPSPQPRLVIPKGGKSALWNHFGFEVGDEGQEVNKKEVCCRICNKRVSYSGNTSNMMPPVRTWHPDKADPSSLVAPPVACSYVMPARKLLPGGNRAKAITRKIVEFIAQDMRPIAVVSGEGFQNMINCLEPSYQIPSRKTMKGVLTDMQKEISSTLKQELQDIKDVPLTTDFWTSTAVVIPWSHSALH